MHLLQNRGLVLVLMLLLSTSVFGQKKEFNKALEQGENSLGYIDINYKHPQDPAAVKTLCDANGYVLLTWVTGKTIKFGDHVEGPLYFTIMKQGAYQTLRDDCRTYSVPLDVKNLESCIFQVNSAKRAKLEKEAREQAEQQRINALAAQHVTTFTVDPNWSNFSVTNKRGDVQFVSYKGYRGVTFKGTKTWIIPPLYKNIGNYDERFFIVSNSFFENPIILDRNNREIKWTVTKEHNRRNGILLQVIRGNNGLLGLLRTNKDGTKLIAFPPIAQAYTDLIHFEKENLVFSGHTENDIIAFAGDGYLGFLNQNGGILIDSIEQVEPRMFKLPVLPFTEFMVLQRHGEQFYFDPIKLEGYTKEAVRRACNNSNERQIAESFVLFKTVAKGMKAGLELLLEYSNKYTNNGNSGHSLSGTKAAEAYTLSYSSKFADAEVTDFKPNNYSTTTVKIYSNYNNDSSTKDYFTDLVVIDKNGEVARKVSYTDAYKDNDAEISFDPRYDDHIEVSVRYGSTEHSFFGKPEYKGIGAIFKLSQQGTYTINVFPKK